MRTPWLAVLGLAVIIPACSKEQPRQEEPAGDRPSAQTGEAGDASGPMGSATIKGVVKFTGTAPQNPVIDMAEEPACKDKHSGTPRQPIVVANSSGGLGNVFVYVKSGIPAGAQYTAPSGDVELDQEGCLYEPRVIGMMVGQKLKIKNSDPVLHNIKAMAKVNRPFNISQPTKDLETERTFTSSEVMIPFECNVHGWMHAYAGVLPHPFYATTGADGSFSIEKLPAGSYTIEFWHEKFGAQTVQITVNEGETKTADYTFTAK
jgi:hypothetical protein